MSKRLTPYGSTDQAANIAKVGKNKTPQSLVARMPSAELAAKVGGTPMPSPSPSPSPRVQLRRVERLNSRV